MITLFRYLNIQNLRFSIQENFSTILEGKIHILALICSFINRRYELMVLYLIDDVSFKFYAFK